MFRFLFSNFTLRLTTMTSYEEFAMVFTGKPIRFAYLRHNLFFNIHTTISIEINFNFMQLLERKKQLLYLSSLPLSPSSASVNLQQIFRIRCFYKNYLQIKTANNCINTFTPISFTIPSIFRTVFAVSRSY